MLLMIFLRHLLKLVVSSRWLRSRPEPQKLIRIGTADPAMNHTGWHPQECHKNYSDACFSRSGSFLHVHRAAGFGIPWTLLIALLCIFPFFFSFPSCAQTRVRFPWIYDASGCSGGNTTTCPTDYFLHQAVVSEHDWSRGYIGNPAEIRHFRGAGVCCWFFPFRLFPRCS